MIREIDPLTGKHNLGFFASVLTALSLGIAVLVISGSASGQTTGFQSKIYRTNGGDKMVVASGGQIEILSGGAITRVGNEKVFPAGAGKAGATAGWAFPSAHSGFTNSGVVGLPASQTASTWVIPVQGLKVGDTITDFKVSAQIESAGGTVTLDADLRKLTAVAADVTDASVGAITQVSVTADTKVSSSKTLATPEVVAADEEFYILLTGTTAASTDVQLLGATITVTEG